MSQKSGSLFRKIASVAFAGLMLCSCAGTTDFTGSAQRKHFDKMQAVKASPDASFPAKGRVTNAREKTLDVGGVQRAYLFEDAAEDNLPEGARLPIVILLHENNQNPKTVWQQTSLPTLAGPRGFLLAAPAALGGVWNYHAVMGPAAPEGAEPEDITFSSDYTFISDIIQTLVADYRGDPARVYLVGFSAGGTMAMLYMCGHANMIQSAAFVAAALPTFALPQCQPSRAIPILMMNGTNDRITPFAGVSANRTVTGKYIFETLPAEETFRFWADTAGCAPESMVDRLASRSQSYDVWAERRVRGGCNVFAGPGRQVPSSQFYVLHGSGHTWPGADIDFFTRVLGGANQDFDSGLAITDYFGLRPIYRPH